MESAKPAISQKEYLKRYLMKDKKTKVKKKKSISSSTHLKRSVIIDDDINIDEVPRVIDDTFSLDHLGDEAPQIVGIIDERPEQIKLEEKYQSGEWKPLKPDSRDESDEPMPDFRRNVGRQGQDDDLSPPRNTDKGKSKWKSSTVQSYREKSSDGSDGSDFRSPPRGNWKREGLVGRERHEDVRKPKESRKQAREASSLSPSRSGRSKESSSRSVKGDDNWKHESGDGGFSTKGVQSEDSDLSPPRPSTRDKDLNRRGFKSYKSDRNEDKRKSRDDKSRRNDRSDNYSDLSPPRPDKRKSSAESQGDKNKDEWVKKSRSDRSSRWAEPDKHRGKERPPDGSDSDLDVPRRSAINGDKQRGSSQKGRSSSASRQRSNRNDGDSDLSPPRRDRPDDHSESSRKRKTGSDSDLSPPRRRGGGDSDLSPRKSRSGKDDAKRNREKLDQMQDGKRAGLQDAKSLKDELRLLKEKEDEMFRKMDPELLGRSTAAVVRDRKTGMRRDLEKERQKEREKSAKNAVRQQKYEKWGKGLKQVREQEEKVADMVHEMSKPLARYADDVDLDRALKAQEREGDPMLEYIRRHQKESHSVDLTVGGVRKRYIGSYLPNRFSVAPGHRWDGVDRSNGYEQKWFEAKNAKKATAEEAWKWSSADM